MKTRAAVLEKGSKEFEIVELDVDEPRVGEVHIKYTAAGLLVTKTYTLEQVNDGYQDLRDGKLIRGVRIHQ